MCANITSIETNCQAKQVEKEKLKKSIAEKKKTIDDKKIIQK